MTVYIPFWFWHTLEWLGGGVVVFAVLIYAWIGFVVTHGWSGRGRWGLW